MPYPIGANSRRREPRPRVFAVAVARTAPRLSDRSRLLGLALALGCVVELVLALASLAR